MDKKTQLNDFKSRVEKAFSSQQTLELQKEYLTRIQDSLDHIEELLRNATLLLIILMLAFESFSRAIISEVSVGPFKVNDLSIIHKILPILVAYYFFDFSSLLDRRMRYRNLHKAILDHVNKDISENQLDKYLIPRFNLILYDLDYSSNTKLEKFLNIITFLTAFPMLFIFPLIFESYSYYRLFTQYGLNDFITWGSLTISFFLLLQGYIIFFLASDR